MSKKVENCVCCEHTELSSEYLKNVNGFVLTK